jgi:hypothetical protein
MQVFSSLETVYRQLIRDNKSKNSLQVIKKTHFKQKHLQQAEPEFKGFQKNP